MIRMIYIVATAAIWIGTGMELGEIAAGMHVVTAFNAVVDSVSLMIFSAVCLFYVWKTTR